MKTISLAELARRLGVSQPTISKIADSIPGQVRIGQRLRFREDIALSFFANGGMPKGGDDKSARSTRLSG
jgi:hypothetical protein